MIINTKNTVELKLNVLIQLLFNSFLICNFHLFCTFAATKYETNKTSHNETKTDFSNGRCFVNGISGKRWNH